MTIAPTQTNQTRYPYVTLWAVLYMVLFCAGLFPVTALSAKPLLARSLGKRGCDCELLSDASRPGIDLSLAAICGDPLSGSLYCNSGVPIARVRDADGSAWAALLGGFLVVADGMGAGLLMWALIHPVVARDPGIALGLYYASYALGAQGFLCRWGVDGWNYAGG